MRTKDFMGVLKYKRHFICLIMLMAGIAPQVALATESDWNENEHVKVRIISAVDGVGYQESILLGLHFQLKPGWKIYWRSPGDAGYPPQMDWTESINLARVTTNWPAPIRFSVLGLETVGYKDEVVIPLNIIPLVPNKKIIANAKEA